MSCLVMLLEAIWSRKVSCGSFAHFTILSKIAKNSIRTMSPINFRVMEIVFLKSSLLNTLVNFTNIFIVNIVKYRLVIGVKNLNDLTDSMTWQRQTAIDNWGFWLEISVLYYNLSKCWVSSDNQYKGFTVSRVSILIMVSYM